MDVEHCKFGFAAIFDDSLLEGITSDRSNSSPDKQLQPTITGQVDHHVASTIYTVSTPSCALRQASSAYSADPAPRPTHWKV